MGLYELREMDYEAQKAFAKEYLPLIYMMLEEPDEDVAIEKDENDMSPMLPSFDSNDEMFFTRTGRRVDR